MRIKPIDWLGDSRQRVRDFPDPARSRAGFELWEVQQGKEPSDWKPMATVGIGVKEIRVHAGKEYRIIYVARFSEAVYVIHAFDKKARRTPKSEIDLARTRYRNMLNTRKQK